jgi:ribosomal protein S18 acetylase RimI-like enzyme
MITIKNGSEIPLEDFRKAIYEIHSTVNWEHYNESVDIRSSLVALVGEKIVGYVSSSSFWGSEYIPFIAVNKNFQNRKIGQALLLGVVNKCRKAGIKILELDFRSNNTQTKSFYEHFAEKNMLIFKIEPSGLYSNGDPRLHLTLTLPESS